MLLKPFVLVSFMLGVRLHPPPTYTYLSPPSLFQLSHLTSADSPTSLFCCKMVTSLQDPDVQALLNLLDVVLSGPMMVGLDCTPLPIKLGSTCSANNDAQAVVCDEDLIGGLIATNCSAPTL
ncbi:hypothetical protein R3P38DRAFT_409349 [Favolaschia claudopus]|uniref:Hydrophobin n=1 Tax=Favolaschia claudopus TaxID=2862362 RepID=A0AAV9ZHI1_9AGAR